MTEDIHITVGGSGGGCSHHTRWVWQTIHSMVMAVVENIHTMVADMAETIHIVAVGIVEPAYILAD